MQTIKYRMDKQQEATVQHKELYSISYDKPYGKKTWKKMCIGITESLCCIAEVNTTLQINYTSTVLKLFQLIWNSPDKPRC